MVGENPADCLRNDTVNGVPVVTDLSNVITEGAVVDGDVVDGALHEGDVTNVGGITYGATTLFVNGKQIG